MAEVDAVGQQQDDSRVAVVETSYVGDVVLTSVLARSLRRAWPQTEIVLIARPGPVRLAEGLGFHRGIAFDKRGQHAGFSGIERLAQRLRDDKFRALIVPHRSLRSALLAWRSKVFMRVGFAGQRTGLPMSSRVAKLAFTHSVPFARQETTYTQRLLSLLEPLEIPASEQWPQYRPSLHAKQSVSDLLIGAGAQRNKLVVLLPGSVWPTKRWPTEHFARLAGLLLERGLRPIVVGAEYERPLLEAIQGAMTSGGKVVDGIGTSLDEAAEIMRRARRIVAGDTGLLHLGLAAGARAVALFGPTDAGQFDWPETVRVLSQELPCRPCSEHGQQQCPEKHHDCMQALDAERVLTAVQDLDEG